MSSMDGRPKDKCDFMCISVEINKKNLEVMLIFFKQPFHSLVRIVCEGHRGTKSTSNDTVR
jgi:hypothetical protein